LISEPTTLGAAAATRCEIVASYDYRDAAGALLCQTLRYRAWSRRGWRRPDGNGGWVYNLKGVARVLYRLPELLAADPAKWVFIVQRESDADALATLGLVATCNAARRAAERAAARLAWAPLAGRRVAIIPQNNVKGWIWADDTAERLAATASEIKLVSLPGRDMCVAGWLARTRKETVT